LTLPGCFTEGDLAAIGERGRIAGSASAESEPTSTTIGEFGRSAFEQRKIKGQRKTLIVKYVANDGWNTKERACQIL
jgi:hypothetical protein